MISGSYKLKHFFVPEFAVTLPPKTTGERIHPERFVSERFL
jgi:hypothetical protein